MLNLARFCGAAVLVVLTLAGCEDATRGPTTGDLTISISGLPGGMTPSVTLTGPNGFTRTLSGNESLADLKPGDYTIAAANVAAGDVVYTAAEPTQTVTVTIGQTQQVQVSYVNLNTTLTVTLRGLPSGRTSPVRITGPNGLDRTITASTRLAGLTEGTYVITGAGLVVGDSTYQARPARQDYYMTGSYPGATDVSYTAAGHRSLNLRVSGMYLMNAVQTTTGSIPLIQNRDAFIRVFATADQANTGTPWVRVRVYDALTLVRTFYLTHESPTVPTTSGEGALETSWNIPIPAELVKSTMRVDVEVDPDNAVVESNEADNLFPATGGPMVVNTVAPAPLRIRFVPIQIGAGAPGNVSQSNMESFLGFTRKVFPVPSAIQADVHATYVNSGSILDSNGGGWVTVLSEMEMLRAAEGAANTHYVGVVKVGYKSGVAGMAYVPSQPQPGGSALVWDYLPSGDEVTAHELGHNFGRRHAPCGNPGGPDPAFPHGGGTIGVFGYDIVSRALKVPIGQNNSFDLMGYCDRNWISDYTYEGVRNFRSAAASKAQPAVQSTVLVWGRVGNEGLVVEPAFQLRTRPTAPAQGGAYVAEGLDQAGAVLFSMSFDPERIADHRPNDRVFALAVPLSEERAARVSTIRVRGGGDEAVVRSSGASAPARVGMAMRDPMLTLESEAGGVALRWDRAAHPLILVRDASTNEIVTIARGGRATLPKLDGAVDLVMSDGARSVSRRLSPGVN